MRIHEDGKVRLAEHVNEAGGHDPAARMDAMLGGGARQVADGCNPPLPDWFYFNCL